MIELKDSIIDLFQSLKPKILAKLKKIPFDYKSIQWTDSNELKILTTWDNSIRFFFTSIQFNEWFDSIIWISRNPTFATTSDDSIWLPFNSMNRFNDWFKSRN